MSPTILQYRFPLLIVSAALAATVFGQPPAESETKAQSKSIKSRIEEELQKPTTIDVVEMPLSDVVDYLAELHRIPIVLDEKELDYLDITPDTAINLNVDGIRLESCLGLLLEPLGLDWAIRHEALLITSASAAEIILETKVYDVSKILTRSGEPFEDEADLRYDYQGLIDFVTSATDNESWSDSGGPGTASCFQGMLIVQQNRRVHQQLQGLLDQVAEARRLRAANGLVRENSKTAADTELQIVTYRLLTPAERRMAANPQLEQLFQIALVERKKPDAQTVTEALLNDDLRIFARQQLSEEQSARFSKQLADIVTETLEPASWKSAGGKAEIHSIAGGLIVKQTPAVHAKVRRLLEPFMPPKTDQADPSELLPYGYGGQGFGLGNLGGMK